MLTLLSIKNVTLDQIDFGRWEEKFIPETKEILWMKTQSNFYEYNLAKIQLFLEIFKQFF